MYKHLVSSGCSFADNEYADRWPHFLARNLDVKLHNRGQGSSGNDWISMSTIYQTNLLLQQGIPSEDILVVVMWSGISRGSIFLNKEETAGFDEYVNKEGGNTNPVNFWDNEPNKQQKPTDRGFLVGSPWCTFLNDNITKLKKLHAENIYNNEWQMISSLNYWLQLQWFCKIHNIRLINLTFTNIFHFPYYPYKGLNNLIINDPPPLKFYETYSKTTKYLFDMLDLSQWWFNGDNFDGMYEWVIKNGYPLYPQNDLHPAIESHEIFVNKVLIPLVKNEKE